MASSRFYVGLTDPAKYIIRSSNKKPRLKSKLYLFNSFGLIGETSKSSSLVSKHLLTKDQECTALAWCPTSSCMSTSSEHDVHRENTHMVAVGSQRSKMGCALLACSGQP